MAGIKKEYQKIDLWSTGEAMADMWAAHAANYSEEGTLREIHIRKPGSGGAAALMVSVFIEPGSDSSVGNRQDGGFLHLLPSFTIDEELLAEGFLATLTPWTSPALYGLRGYPQGNIDHGRIWYITYEQPWEALPFSSPKKIEREQLQVDRFCSDSSLTLGEAPYDAYERGSDPPDFVCTYQGKSISLECTQFVITERRVAQDFLTKLRQRVATAARTNRKAFSHLAGLCMFLRFGDSGRAAYPPAPSNEAAIEERDKYGPYMDASDADEGRDEEHAGDASA